MIITNIINNRSVNIWNSLNNNIIKYVSLSSFKNKINKICFDKQLFLIEIYNMIFICVSFCILFIALSLPGFFLKKIVFIIEKLNFYIYISNIL